MRKLFLKKYVALIIAILLLFTASFSVSASSVRVDEIPNDTYVYWNNSTRAYSTKASYIFNKELDGKDLGISYTSLTDIANDSDGNLYILDSEASTIFVLDSKYGYKYSFGKTTYNGEEVDFSGAQGIECRDGKLFVCDTNNERVLKMNLDGSIESIILLPDSDMIPDDFTFKPIKIRFFLLFF